MNVVKTKAGEELERRLAPTAAAPLLTDWIPCTTPPVREGEYEVKSTLYGTETWRASYRDGQWFTAKDGFTTKAGMLMSHTMSSPQHNQWRGVRRWVLTVQCFVTRGRSYVSHVSKRGVLYMTDELVKPTISNYKYTAALSFETEAEAITYATKHARHLRDWKAVLA